MKRRPPSSTLFPSPTPFRSLVAGLLRVARGALRAGQAGPRPAGQRPVPRAGGRTGQLRAGQVTGAPARPDDERLRSEEHTSELQSRQYLVCRLLLEKKKKQT